MTSPFQEKVEEAIKTNFMEFMELQSKGRFDAFRKKTDYRYRTLVHGEVLDYWPSFGKWEHLGKTYTGSAEKLLNFVDRNTYRIGDKVKVIASKEDLGKIQISSFDFLFNKTHIVDKLVFNKHYKQNLVYLGEEDKLIWVLEKHLKLVRRNHIG